LVLDQHGVALRELGRLDESEAVLTEAARAQEIRWRDSRPDRRRAAWLVLSAYRDLALVALERKQWTRAWVDLERFSSRVAVDAAIARGELEAGQDCWQDLLPRVQRSLPDSAAMVGWLDSRYGGRLPDWPFWCFVIRKSGEPVWFHVAPDTSQAPLLDQVQHYVQAMQVAAEWPLRVESDDELDALGREMYRLRFAPLEPALQGIRTLDFASPDMNYCVPAEAMIDVQGRYLADRFITVYSPSALVYAAAREHRATQPEPRRWNGLLVGDPARGQTSISDSLPPLRNAAREIDDIAHLLPHADVLLGAGAKEAVLDSMRAAGTLAGYDFIHFATHARIVAPWDEQSALLLAEAGRGATAKSTGAAAIDGWLTSAEIAESWRLRAQLVSLAACRGSSRVISFANGPPGIGTAFLDAGARCVLLSPYAVDDEASSMLFQHFSSLLFSHPRTRADCAAALRESRLWLRNYRTPEGSRPFASPAFWAAFVLFGWPS
jgi:CHAT domain-containing protein